MEAIGTVAIFDLSNTESTLGDIAGKVALNNFNYQLPTLLLYSTSLHYGVEVFLRTFYYNVILNVGVFNPRLMGDARQYVIFGTDVDDLEQLLDSTKKSSIDNTGKFIFVCQSRDLYDCKENVMVNLFWERTIVNVVYLQEEEGRVFGYTYFPITESNCSNIIPAKLNSSFFYRRRLYENKFRNLHSCPLIISTFVQAPYMNIIDGKPVGADGDLLEYFEYGLNTSFKVMLPTQGTGWGFRDRNGTWMGSLADIYYGLANFSITSAALTESRFSDFQISHSYRSISVVWVTHPAEFQNVALKLLHPFGEDARLALLFSFLLVVLCALVTKTNTWRLLSHKLFADQPVKSIVFYSWMICMGQTINKLPTRSTFLQLAFVWILYCFLIRTAYQVYLISSLKGKFYERQFNTIEEAIEAEYSYGGGAALKDFYKDYPIVRDNWTDLDTSKMVANALNISRGMKFVQAMNLDMAKMIVKEYQVNLYVLPEKIITCPTVLSFKKNSPLIGPINTIIDLLTASGYPDRKHRTYTRGFTLVSNERDEEKLTIVHLTACYVILFTGWLVSGIFFSMELYFGKYCKHPTILS